MNQARGGVHIHSQLSGQRNASEQAFEHGEPFARGISVNTLAPGAIETDFGGGAVRDNEQLNKMIAGMTALGRVGLPADIGAAVSVLLAPETHWMTAQRIEVSGGTLI